MSKQGEDAQAAGVPSGRRRRAVPDRFRRGGRAEPAPARDGEAGEPAGSGPGAAAPSRPEVPRRSWGAALLRAFVLLLAFVGMVAFAVVLARVTLVSVPGAVGQVHSNVRPGDSLRHYLMHATTVDAAQQVGGNVLLGLPFGALLPVLLPKARGLLRVLFWTALVMLLVELVQGALISGRAFDIDDVILNSAGALLGYLLLGRRIARAVHRRPGARVGPVTPVAVGR